MIRKRKKSTILVFGFALPLLAVILLFGVYVNRSITTVFEVFPSQKWMLTKGSEAQITACIRDYQSAVSKTISVVQFERGESMNFTLRPSIAAKSRLEAGDTIAVIHSSRLQERLTGLKGDLLIAQANLAAKSAGEKQSMIDEVRKRIEFSEVKILEKKIPFERIQELFKRGYSAKEEFDIARLALKQAEIENEINHAQLAVYRSGSKEEDLHVLRSTIQSLRSEICVLEERMQDCVLRSPISGEIVRNFSQDTLLIVHTATTLILTVQIRYEQIGCLAEGDTVRISFKNISAPLPGTVVGIAKEVETVHGVQILSARIMLKNPPPQLKPGLTVGGEIIVGRERLFDYFASLFGT